MSSNKWYSISQLSKIYKFAGKATVNYMAIGALVGVVLFLTEAAFAYALQSFLVAIEVLSRSSTQLPSWVPQNSLKAVLIFVCGVGFVRGLLQWVQVYFLEAVGEVQKCEQRHRLVDFAFTSKSANSAEVLALFNEHINYVGVATNQLQNVCIRLTAALGMFCWLVYVAPLPTMIFTGGLAAIGLFSRFLDRKIRFAAVEISNDYEKINSSITNNIRNLMLMHVYGTQNDERVKIKRNIDSYLRHCLTYANNCGLIFALPQIFGVVLMCSITLLIRRTHSVAPGNLISYFYMAMRFVQVLAETTRNTSGLQFYFPRVGRLAKWWADNALDSPVRRKVQAPVSPTQNSIELNEAVGWRFNNVTYRYDEADKAVFTALNVEIPPIKTTVITGPSGTGKSTLVHLMLGNLDPTSGTVGLLRGKLESPLNDARSSLLKNIGYVSSDGFIINGTILENLNYGLTQKPTLQAVEQALRKAECQFVFELPLKLEHLLTEQGHGLSAGQKQRLSLARALLRNPKVLILDEATSNLDNETEERLVQTLATFKNDMTIVAVTHRLGLLKIADHKIEFN